MTLLLTNHWVNVWNWLECQGILKTWNIYIQAYRREEAQKLHGKPTKTSKYWHSPCPTGSGSALTVAINARHNIYGTCEVAVACRLTYIYLILRIFLWEIHIMQYLPSARKSDQAKCRLIPEKPSWSLPVAIVWEHFHPWEKFNCM